MIMIMNAVGYNQDPAHSKNESRVRIVHPVRFKSARIVVADQKEDNSYLLREQKKVQENFDKRDKKSTDNLPA
jgi:hypothetical protein